MVMSIGLNIELPGVRQHPSTDMLYPSTPNRRTPTTQATKAQE